MATKSTLARLSSDNRRVAEPTPRKPHVLTLTDVVGLGGAEGIAEDLAVRVDPGRFRRSLCTTRALDPIAGSHQSLARLRDAGVDVLRLERRDRGDLRSMLRLVKRLRSERVDLIHAHKFGSNAWAAVLGRALSIPVRIAHEHTWSFEGQPVRRFVDRNLIARFCDVVIAVSEADRERMISLVGMPADKVVVVPNGISWPDASDPDRVRRELGIGPDDAVLVQTAVLRPQKAIGVMLNALAILHRTHPQARLLIAGSGDEAPLRAIAAELRLGEAVSFLGARADVAELLASARVGVLSSDFEGMPLAALEYMAAGLPVVATAVGGLPEMVREGDTGLLVPPRDPEALADRLRRLLDDPGLARDMGARGRVLARARFSTEAMVGHVTDLYVRLLAERGIAVPPAATAGRPPAVAGPGARP